MDNKKIDRAIHLRMDLKKTLLLEASLFALAGAMKVTKTTKTIAVNINGVEKPVLATKDDNGGWSFKIDASRGAHVSWVTGIDHGSEDDKAAWIIFDEYGKIEKAWNSFGDYSGEIFYGGPRR